MKRRLIESPERWRRSSFRADSTGEAGPVAVNACQVLKIKIRAASRIGLKTSAANRMGGSLPKKVRRNALPPTFRNGVTWHR